MSLSDSSLPVVEPASPVVVFTRSADVASFVKRHRDPVVVIAHLEHAHAPNEIKGEGTYRDVLVSAMETLAFAGTFLCVSEPETASLRFAFERTDDAALLCALVRATPEIQGGNSGVAGFFDYDRALYERLCALRP